MISPDQDSWLEKLQAYIQEINVDDVAVEAAKASTLPISQLRHVVDVFCNEAVFSLRLVGPALRPGMRVLEIGSGLGILAGFLVSMNIDVIGIEPGMAGFDYVPALARAIADRHAKNGFRSLPISATELDPQKHGRFDLIYSIHVMEHVRELDTAFSALARVLAPQGLMLHLCPNYTVPYDPHLGIPLIPGFPRATRFLFPARIAQNKGVWDGLNFVTNRDIRRLATKNGLSVEFDHGVMGDFMRRIEYDDIFRRRQSSGAIALVRMALRTRAITLIDRLPSRISTPMVARFRNVAGSSRGVAQ